MEPERWQTIKDIFEGALDLSSADENAYLDRACSGDSELRAEVESLLRAHRSAGHFIEAPAKVAGDVVEEDRLDPLLGIQCGPYRIGSEIARGGMGTVYEAARVDAQYQRRVAIKVVHAGMDAGSVIERFRNERQILANLDHPNIARLLDGGTMPGGRPYFVMEFVDGTPIDRYCDKQKLALNDRLRLFQSVAAAVHHAHQHLVIHRDIKPTNVLVTSEGVPKLLDFGIAKLLDSSDGAPGRTLTKDAHPMTPEYASPEQVRGELLTTATDVYSLGVLLYELLTGRGPYVLATHHPKELADAICGRHPPKPSTVMAGAPNAETREPRLSRKLRGDLDNIVLKALHKETGRRYSSALEFAGDIECYLQAKPVAARPDTLFYRTGKFVRRHKAGVTLTASAVALLIAAFAVTAFQYSVAQRERDRAERRFADVRELANTFMFDIHDSIQQLPGSTAARQRLVETALRYLDGLNTESKGDRELERELAAAYERVAQIQSSAGEANIGDNTGAIENRRKALVLRESRALANPDDSDAQLEWASSLGRLGVILLHTDTKAAIALQRKSVELCQAADARVHSPKTRQAVEAAYYFLGSALVQAGDIDDALKAFTRNTELLEARAREAPEKTSIRSDLALTNKRIGALLGMNGRSDEAFERYRRALDTEQAILQSNPISVDVRRAVSVTYSDIGWLLNRTGDPKAAIESYRKAYEIRQSLADADPDNMDMKKMLASTLSRLGLLIGNSNVSEAEAFHRKALSLLEAIAQRDPRNPDARHAVSAGYNSLGQVAFNAGKFRDASGHHSKAVAIVRDLAQSNPTNRQYNVDSGLFSISLGATYLKFASSPATATEVEQCQRLEQARMYLDEGMARIRSLQERGQLLQDERSALEFATRELDETRTELARMRSSGSCTNPLR